MPLGDSPWRVADLVRFGSRIVLGLVAIIVAWAGASGTVTWRDQVIWVAVGVAATVFVAGSGVAWLLNGMAAVTDERATLRARMLLQLQLGGARVVDEPADPTEAPVDLVWADGMRHAHLSSCDVVAGKTTVGLTRAQASARGLQTCRMCQP
jgi:hypothetical protein